MTGDVIISFRSYIQRKNGFQAGLPAGLIQEGRMVSKKILRGTHRLKTVHFLKDRCP
jgi:hypothetical protein